MSRLGVTSALLLAALACALCLTTEVQAQASACNFNGQDFSPLMGTDYPGSDGTGQYTYYLAVCGPLTSSAAATCTQPQPATSACQVATKGGTYDVGNWGTPAPTWSYIDANEPGKGVQYKMTGAPTCWATNDPMDYYAVVQLTCAPQLGSLTVTVPAGSCTQTYNLPTPLACVGGAGGSGGPGGKKGGLSGGWIFIIIVLVLFPVYIAVGCLYKSQKLGATGMDKCPNIEFWRELPSLVKDGCVFCVSKLRGLCGGGGAHGKDAGSYETM